MSKKRYVLFSLSPSLDIASHRLRIFAAAESLQSRPRNLIIHEFVLENFIAWIKGIAFRIGNFLISRSSARACIVTHNILIASKPFDFVNALKLLAFKSLRLGKVIVDISDDYSLVCQKNVSTNYKRYQQITLGLADLITCPTMAISTSLHDYSEKLVIVPDAADFISCPGIDGGYHKYHPLRAHQILWYGSSGSLVEGNFKPSPSLTGLVDFLQKLYEDLSSRSILTSTTLVVCSNHPGHVANYLSAYSYLFSAVKCIQWSLVAMKKQLTASGSILLTYSDDFYSQGKSPNRIQLGLASGLPLLVVNPPSSSAAILDDRFKSKMPVYVCHTANYSSAPLHSLIASMQSQFPVDREEHKKVLRAFEKSHADLLALWVKCIARLV